MVKSLNPRQPRSKLSRSLRQIGSWAAPFLPSQSGSPSCRSLFFVAQCSFRARQNLLHMLANSITLLTVLHSLPAPYKKQTFQPQVLLHFALPGIYRLEGTPGGRLQPPAQSTGDTKQLLRASFVRVSKNFQGQKEETPWKLNMPRLPDWTFPDKINWPSKLQESTINANNERRLCCSDTVTREFTAEDRTCSRLSFLSTFSHL